MKNLHFSNKSMLYLYIDDHQYSDVKSFSTVEKARFSREAVQDVMRIRLALKEDGEKDNGKNTCLPVASRLEACGISKDEVIGIEQLALEDPKNICMRRKTHIQAVLLAQSLAQDMKNNRQDDAVCMLAQMSSKISRKCTSQARQRAARAA